VPVALFQPDDPAHRCFIQRVGAFLRASAFLLQPANAMLQKTLVPLVARFRTDLILPAQLPEVGGLQRLERKFSSFIHWIWVGPRHPTRYLCPEPNALPMS